MQASGWHKADMETSTTTETRKIPKAVRALSGQRKRTLRLDHVREFASALFEEANVHAKRVESLGNGVAGVLNAAMLTIHAIGQAYAAMAHIEAIS